MTTESITVLFSNRFLLIIILTIFFFYFYFFEISFWVFSYTPAQLLKRGFFSLIFFYYFDFLIACVLHNHEILPYPFCPPLLRRYCCKKKLSKSKLPIFVGQMSAHPTKASIIATPCLLKIIITISEEEKKQTQKCMPSVCLWACCVTCVLIPIVVCVYSFDILIWESREQRKEKKKQEIHTVFFFLNNRSRLLFHSSAIVVQLKGNLKFYLGRAAENHLQAVSMGINRISWCGGV